MNGTQRAAWRSTLIDIESSKAPFMNCDRCGAKIILVGKRPSAMHRLTYTTRDGRSEVCDRVFCSSDCARIWVRGF